MIDEPRSFGTGAIARRQHAAIRAQFETANTNEDYQYAYTNLRNLLATLMMRLGFESLLTQQLVYELILHSKNFGMTETASRYECLFALANELTFTTRQEAKPTLEEERNFKARMGQGTLEYYDRNRQELIDLMAASWSPRK